MQLVRTIDEARRILDAAREDRMRIALVPTMGYLHEGHLSLVDLAREHADFVVVSIFVNPKQFGPSEDLATYPRDEEHDRLALESRNVDLLFAPPPEEVYPEGFATTVSVGGVAQVLEGERRPGHFDGVATVVLKLLHIVEPDVAVFGQKDAQQCAVIRRLVEDLDLRVEIITGEIRREPDGVAMSSRNSYLTDDERGRAILLSQALATGRSVIERGGSPEQAEAAMIGTVEGTESVRVDYLRVVDPDTFESPRGDARELLVVGAIHVGTTRLIDNMKVGTPEGPAGFRSES